MNNSQKIDITVVDIIVTKQFLEKALRTDDFVIPEERPILLGLHYKYQNILTQLQQQQQLQNSENKLN